MSYQKQNFANGEVLTALELNHIEQGIADVESAANATKFVVDKIIDPTLSLSGKAADAAKVGEAVGQVKEDLGEITEIDQTNICPTPQISTVPTSGSINESCGIIGHIEAGKQYTFSANNVTSYTNQIIIRMNIGDAWVTQCRGNLKANTKTVWTFTATNTGKVSLNGNVGVVTSPLLTECQLELGAEASDYVPYQKIGIKGQKEQNLKIAKNTENIAKLMDETSKSHQVDLFIKSRYTYSSDNPVVTFLNFSDIHNNKEQFRRIMNFYNSNSVYIDDILCNGDIPSNRYYEDNMENWNAVEGHEKVLFTIGNHEYYNGVDNIYSSAISMNTAYQHYFAPYIDNWNVSNHPTEATYWYKDYPNSKLRLIALDCMLGSYLFTDKTDYNYMISWLGNALSDANAKGYHVVIAYHCPPIRKTTWVKSSFTRTDIESACGNTTPELTDEILSTVQSFIDAGGNFACYLCGHIHNDAISYKTGYPKQICITVGVSALHELLKNGDVMRLYNDYSIDLFNIVTFDTSRKTIRVVRIGADITFDCRERKMICIDYRENKIISE